jgi:hypothetical protein
VYLVIALIFIRQDVFKNKTFIFPSKEAAEMPFVMLLFKIMDQAFYRKI